MDHSFFDSMDRTQLQSYLEFLLRNYRQVDAFWFIYTAEKYGQTDAEQLNEQVWSKMGGLSAREIISRFDIREKGLKGFLKALGYFPWSMLIGYVLEEKNNEVTLTVPHCPAQEARKQRGLGEYVCKQMHYNEFNNFAKTVDSSIQVECIYAPPDSHPEVTWCKWRFYCK